jgi:hypothetical protein
LIFNNIFCLYLSQIYLSWAGKIEQLLLFILIPKEVAADAPVFGGFSSPAVEAVLSSLGAVLRFLS